MARIICIAAPLAGAGKTTAAINLSAAFAVFEHQTLLVDCAPDNRCLLGTVIEPPAHAPGLARALQLQEDVARYCVPTRLEFLRVLPAGQGLDQAINDPAAAAEDRQWFSEMLCAQAREHDVIVLDTATALNGMLAQALCNADELLIAMRIDPPAVRHMDTGFASLRQLLEKAAGLRKSGKSELRVSGILLNCCDNAVEAEALLGPGTFDQIRHACLPVLIPEDQRLHEAYWLGKPAVCHDIAAPGAQAYLDLAALWGRAREKSKAEEKEVHP
ncbi:MAG: ParA family protein [Desulfobacterales bacterium]|nr:ParA family protein [Desulfobacterales bacterium]MBS3754754.1 ParA family protein [Desulfobacterales bacterium]